MNLCVTRTNDIIPVSYKHLDVYKRQDTQAGMIYAYLEDYTGVDEEELEKLLELIKKADVEKNKQDSK